MSVFTQATTAFQTQLNQWTSTLHDEVQEQIEILNDLKQQQAAGAEIDLEVLENMNEQASATANALRAFQTSLQPTVTTLTKFHHKAEEGKKNPDQQMYGASMLTKISENFSKLNEFLTAYQPSHDQFHELYQYFLNILAQQRATAAKLAEEKAKQEAAERVRAEAAAREAERVEAERRKAEAERAAAEAKRAAEEAARQAAEKAKAAKAEQEEKQRRDREERERVLAERRAAEAQAQAQAASKSKEEEEKKPLLQRSTERLKAALAELKTGSSNEEYHVALQTLLKFLTNIMGSPNVEKFRYIRSGNDIFQRRLGARPGGLDALKAIGFEVYQTPASLPSGSELQPNAEYYKIDAKAELWPVLVEAKKILEEAMKAVAPATATPAQPAQPSPFPNLGMGGGGFPFFPSPPRTAAGVPPQPTAGFPFPSGATPGGFNGGNPFANPMAMMSDPLMQQILTNPSLSRIFSEAAATGRMPPPGVIQQEMMRNPQLLQSIMSSPMVRGMWANPGPTQQFLAAQGINPFSNFPGGQAPPHPTSTLQPDGPTGTGAAAPPMNPMMAFLNMMQRPPTQPGTGTGAQPPMFPFAQMFQPQPPTSIAPTAPTTTTTTATPTTTTVTPAQPTAASTQPTATPATTAAATANPDAMEVDEEALLAEAIAMSMQAPQPDEKKE